MRKILTIAGSLTLAALLATPVSAAGCVTKGGRGTGSTVPDAKFQAWEAVLQATDWGMWAAWMSSGAKVGHAAAGYKVSNVRERCHAGGSMGKECVIFAKLCK